MTLLHRGAPAPALTVRGDGVHVPLHLGAPSLRYAGAGMRAAAPDVWRRDDGDAWTCDDGAMQLRAEIMRATAPVATDTASAAHRGHAGSSACTLTLSVTALRPVQVAECVIELCAASDSPPRIVERTLSWRALHAEVVLGAGAPLVMRWRDAGGAAFEIRSLRGALPCRACWRDGRASLGVYLDAAALHPRWSFAGRQTRSLAAPVWEVGQRLDVTLLLRQLQEPWDTAPVLAAPMPRGAEAALVITDHCDFDTTERLRTFLHGDGRHRGWLGRGLHLTKGVFTLESNVTGRTPVPTLRDPTYRALACRLRDDGSSIVPHGVNESGNVPPSQFHDALGEIARDFAPGTWIDHGLTLDYCYTMGGAANPEYSLLDALRPHGISTLWSYHDAPSDAAATLNTAAPLDGGVRVRRMRVLRHLANGRPLVAAHYTRSALRARLTGLVGDAVGRSLSAVRGALMGGGRPLGTRARHAVREVVGALGALSAAARGRRDAAAQVEPYTVGELLSLAPVVYPERGVPLSAARADDQLLFATTEVLHTRDGYTPEAIDRLVKSRGIHVGHTYLLNQLPYIAGLFAEGAGPRFSDEWAEFVDALAAQVAAGAVWNPAVAPLAEWMRAMQQVETIPLPQGGAIVHNRSNEVVRDFTLLLPRDIAGGAVQWAGATPAGFRQWHDWLAVWGDLAPQSSTAVRWS